MFREQQRSNTQDPRRSQQDPQMTSFSSGKIVTKEECNNGELDNPLTLLDSAKTNYLSRIEDQDWCPSNHKDEQILALPTRPGYFNLNEKKTVASSWSTTIELCEHSACFLRPCSWPSPLWLTIVEMIVIKMVLVGGTACDRQ